MRGFHRRTSKSKPRLTSCFCFIGLFLTAIVSLVFFIVHANGDSSHSNWSEYFKGTEHILNNFVGNFHLRKDSIGQINENHNHPTEIHPQATMNVLITPTVHPTTSPIVSTPLPTSIHSSTFDYSTIHFIHIPKCGGTSMTAILRQLQCHHNPIRNQDCCKNPGFCDWHAFQRCASIKGCVNHFPNMKFVYQSKIPSIALFREPTARLLSAWFYRGHSPNLDFFSVRPYFKEISQGKRPKILFNEYIEMNEYQNIQTRMLGADSFPYRNITITPDIYLQAEKSLDLFYFIGLQEEFYISAEALTRMMGLSFHNITIVKEREQQGMKQIKKQKYELTSNSALMQRLREVNQYDLRLFQAGNK
jgi:hypothetical protein